MKEEIISNFDCTYTAAMWLNKIEQLGQIHNCSDYEKSAYMQVKLKSAARDCKSGRQL